MRRDGALTRLSSITAAIGVGTIAAVGILGIYVGRALPGHHSGVDDREQYSLGLHWSRVGQQREQRNSGNSGQGAINPPSTPTQSAPAQAPVTSGSS